MSGPRCGRVVAVSDLEVDCYEGSVTRRGLAIIRPALRLADGEVCIWNLADEYIDQQIEVSDSYHAAEHLAVCPPPASPIRLPRPPDLHYRSESHSFPNG